MVQSSARMRSSTAVQPEVLRHTHDSGPQRGCSYACSDSGDGAPTRPHPKWDASNLGWGRKRSDQRLRWSWADLWAWLDLNQRPHPHQVSRAKRCAQGRFPRSPASVKGEGMRSNSSAQTAPIRPAPRATQAGRPDTGRGRVRSPGCGRRPGRPGRSCPRPPGRANQRRVLGTSIILSASPWSSSSGSARPAEARRRRRSSRAVSQKNWAVASSRRSGSARMKAK
jgi:hypothetical protein